MPEVRPRRARHRPSEMARRAWGVAVGHPVVAVFLVALAVRVVGALLFDIVGGDVVAVFDDSTYRQLASDMAQGQTDQWDPYSQELFNSTATFTVPLTVLFWLLGVHDIIGPLLSAVWGATAAALTARVLIELVDRRIALGGGLVLALLPSHVLWGSFALKDPAVLAVACGLAMICTVTWRVTHTSRLALWTLTGVLLLVCMAHLRSASFIAALWAFVLAMSVGHEGVRVRILPVLAFVLLGLPAMLGYQMAGIDILTTPQSTVASRREANAVGAATALLPAPRPADEKPVTGTGRPQTQQSEPVEDPDALSANIRHLPRGLSVMLLDPLPWAPTDNARLRAAKAETVLWYPILVLAAVGLTGPVRHLLRLAFPLLFGGAMLVVYALAEGNFGTAYRHRSELGLTITVLAALGLADLVARLARKGSHARAVAPDEPPNSSRTRGPAYPLVVVDKGTRKS